MAWLRQLGCQMISYINNNLILASSEYRAKLWSEMAIALLEELGFMVNYDKYSLDPVQNHPIPGYNIESRAMTVSVPTDKLAQNRARHLWKLDRVSGRTLVTFIGTTSSIKLAILPAPLFYRALRAAKNSEMCQQCHIIIEGAVPTYPL